MCFTTMLIMSMNRNQLGQYWKCVVEDRDFFALAGVIDVVFVKKCLMFFLNSKPVIFLSKNYCH